MLIDTLQRRAAVLGVSLLMTGMTLAISSSVANANLLGNPGFENPATPVAPPEYYGAGAPWNNFGGGIYTVSSVVAPPHTGNQSLKLFGGCCSGAWQQVPTLPGEAWNGGVWMLNFSGDPMAAGQVAAVNIEWIKADGVTQSSITPFISNGTFTGASPRDTWTLQPISGVAPADAAFARLVVITGDFIPGLPPGGAPFYDDAFLDRETVPTAPVSWGLIKNIYR